MKKIPMQWLGVLLGMLCMLAVVIGLTVWFTCRLWVPADKCAVLISKWGDPLPPGEQVATKPGQMGIQPDVLGPGRHFYNPLKYEVTLEDLTEVPAGDPTSWRWVPAPRGDQAGRIKAGNDVFDGKFPQLGVVTRKIGNRHPQGDQVIVKRDSGYQGILEEVLTPGVYKINPYVYEVKLHPAVFIPEGFVGVVTNLFGAESGAAVLTAATQAQSEPTAEAAAAPDTQPAGTLVSQVRPLAKPGQRGTLRNVLQPGVYFINPVLQKVTPIEIGFNEYSQLQQADVNYRISFPSDTGYLIRVGVTVVWGVHPQHAAEIINEFGATDGVLEKVIGPQLRSICRNIGSTFSARDFIQGEKREIFQKALTDELQRVCRAKNIEVLLALIREIEVHAPDGGEGEVTEDLKRTIQQSYIAIENQITKEKQRDAATAKANLEEVKKQVDIARETIQAETRVMAADIQAEGQKQAAETDAQAALEVATIQQEVALLDAKRTEILGQAAADVERYKRDAEAQGYKMLVDAFGSPRAYNLFTFAERFEPESIRLIFAGEGTFWTDLSRFEQVGAAKLLETTSGQHAPAAPMAPLAPPAPAAPPAPKPAKTR